MNWLKSVAGILATRNCDVNVIGNITQGEYLIKCMNSVVSGQNYNKNYDSEANVDTENITHV